MLIATISALLVTQFPNQPVTVDWPLCRQPAPEIVASIDLVGIVESVSTREVVRVRSGTDDKRPIWIDEFKGSSGKGVAKGSRILCVTPRPTDGGRVLAPTKGTKYLLLAFQPKGGRLDFWLGPDMLGYSLVAEPNEVAGLMLFPTKLQTAPEKIDDFVNVVSLVADGFKIQTDENYRRLVLFLRRLGPYHQKAADGSDNYTLDIGAKGPVTYAIAEHIPEATPYRLSKIRELFLRWQLPMSHVDYVRQLMNLMRTDASSYADEPESLVTDFGSVTQTFEARTEVNRPFRSEEEWLNAALAAKNLTLLKWFLENTAFISTETNLRRFAILLTHRDRHVVLLAAQILARALGEHSENQILIQAKYAKEGQIVDQAEKIIERYKRLYDIDG